MYCHFLLMYKIVCLPGVHCYCTSDEMGLEKKKDAASYLLFEVKF